jgi:hypothetical protein
MAEGLDWLGCEEPIVVVALCMPVGTHCAKGGRSQQAACARASPQCCAASRAATPSALAPGRGVGARVSNPGDQSIAL